MFQNVDDPLAIDRAEGENGEFQLETNSTLNTHTKDLGADGVDMLPVACMMTESNVEGRYLHIPLRVKEILMGTCICYKNNKSIQHYTSLKI